MAGRLGNRNAIEARLGFALRLAGGGALLAARLARCLAAPARAKALAEARSPCRGVLFLSFIEWSGARQRPHHLAERFPPEWDVAYVSALRLHHFAAGRKGAAPKRPGMRVAEPLAFPGERRFALLHAANDRLVLDAALRLLDGRAPDAVVVNSPALARPALRMAKRVLVYDLMDDQLDAGAASERYRRDEERLFQAADLVFTGTQSLLEDRRGRHPRMEFLPGGCDYEHFAGGTAERAPLGLKGLKRPIVGFFGALNERLDGPLLARLAEERDWTLALIGPRYRTAPPLPHSSNVRLLGPCPYEALPDALAAFDAAIIPYRTEGAARFVNPVKTLEYFAGGKPVVSSAIPDVERLQGEAVLIARDPEEFVALVRRAIQDPAWVRPRVEAGQRLARARSWEQAAAHMAARIEERWAGGPSAGGPA